jgi:hypothetical protein
MNYLREFEEEHSVLPTLILLLYLLRLPSWGKKEGHAGDEWRGQGFSRNM